MSLEKSITHGREWRKPYRGSKSFDPSCRVHGGCPYCAGGRLHKKQKVVPADLAEQMEPAFGSETGEREGQYSEHIAETTSSVVEHRICNPRVVGSNPTST